MATAGTSVQSSSLGSQSEIPPENDKKKRRFGLFRRRSRASVKDETVEEKPTKSRKHKGRTDSMALCPVCYTFRPKDLFPEISTCEHRSCMECLKQYLTFEINESRVILTCPECAERFHPNDIKLILNDDQLMAKYDQFTLRRALVSDPDCRWCPAPDCSYAVIANGCASCPKLVCERPNCRTEFCYHCKQIWHPNQTCDAARQRRNLGSLSLSDGRSSHSSDDMKTCPRCAALIIKMDDGSCNHMTCAVCGAEFCWLCMKEISDLHYLSPSGCTFWGKKPWSRKKKILWQMGTLIGAPLGIALAAGVVLPAMVIGIPVYVGRQIHDKYSIPIHTSRKRNLAITGGVTLSVLVSPILAALTVGVGVPIALGYIYGVVPVSLCRGGGCATVTTLRSGRGVNLEFDDNDSVSASHLAQFSHTITPYNSRRNSPRISERVSTGGTVTVVATVNPNNADTVSQTSKQPSLSTSQDCSSLDSSTIGGRIGDNDSHASLIPAPRSCTVSIASSFDNFNIGVVDGIACGSSSVNEAGTSECEAKCISEEAEFNSDDDDEEGEEEDDDNLSVVEKSSTTEEVEVEASSS